MATMKSYWNGELLEDKDITVSPWDLGFLRGYGVFEYIAVYNKEAFLLDRHINRLNNSAHLIGLQPHLTKNELENIVKELIEINNLVDGAIRIVLTGGISTNGISKGSTPTLLIRPEFSSTPQADLYEKGGKLITAEYERELPYAKTTQYIEAIKHEEELRNIGAVEVLFVSNQIISECSRSNIFIVSEGTLITPKENILHGITRGVVLELADKLNIKKEERNISLKELLNSDEVFITGTGKRIVPIVEIDGNKISNAKPGVITKKFIEAYEARTRG